VFPSRIPTFRRSDFRIAPLLDPGNAGRRWRRLARGQVAEHAYVTISFAARHGIARAFAYDADLAAEGLAPVTTRE